MSRRAGRTLIAPSMSPESLPFIQLSVLHDRGSALSTSRSRRIKANSNSMMGTVSLIQAAIPHLIESKGNIVTISSVSGRDIDFTAPSPYGAFKAALIHYTAQMAHSLATKGVRANTVSPGNIYIDDGVGLLFLGLSLSLPSLLYPFSPRYLPLSFPTSSQAKTKWNNLLQLVNANTRYRFGAT